MLTAFINGEREKKNLKLLIKTPISQRLPPFTLLWVHGMQQCERIFNVKAAIYIKCNRYYSFFSSSLTSGEKRKENLLEFQTQNLFEISFVLVKCDFNGSFTNIRTRHNSIGHNRGVVSVSVTTMIHQNSTNQCYTGMSSQWLYCELKSTRIEVN